MSVAQDEVPEVSPEVYLALERQTEEKNEYVDGHIVAMSGSSVDHDLISGDVLGLFLQQLGTGPCVVLSSNMKVRAQLKTPSTRKGLFAYPDLTIVCGEPTFHDERRDIITNPKVIFEVLSPSTEDYDFGRKRERYQGIETLTDYLLVAQDLPWVEHWERQPNKRWVVDTIEGLDSTLEIQTIDCKLKLADIYRRVSFPERTIQ
ncbi:MAG TPA: Uma2 family endonuclease [Candidatus Xenobia bacterium]|jgi:Uma2 family endonuclease